MVRHWRCVALTTLLCAVLAVGYWYKARMPRWTPLVQADTVAAPSQGALHTALVQADTVAAPSQGTIHTALVQADPHPAAQQALERSDPTERLPVKGPTDKEVAKALLQADKMMNDCGELCDTDRPLKPGKYYGSATAHVNCPALLANAQIDAQRDRVWCKVPKGRLHDYFTMNGKVPLIARKCFDAPFLGHEAKTPVWTEKHIDGWVGLAKTRTLDGTYSISEANHLIDALPYTEGIAGGRAMVIGSAKPWVEAILLAAGAREVVTLEYGKIESQHPLVKTLTPPELRTQYANGSLGLFDVVVAFSSLEHSGLSRYGDAINPWGDILAVARAWCVTKDGGSFVMALPHGREAIEFNAHRRYGGKRYPYLMANWEQVWRHPDLSTSRNLVHVFKKMPAPP